MVQAPPLFTNSPEVILREANTIVNDARALWNQLGREVAPSKAIFANVLLPLAYMENEFSLTANRLQFYRNIAEDESIRNASQKAQVLFDDFRTECFMREDIFELINSVRDRKEALDDEATRFLTRMYNQHIQCGVGIRNIAAKQRFRDIQDRLSKLKVEFLENIGKDDSTIYFIANELEGVPEEILHRLHQVGTNKYKCYLADSSTTEILAYATNTDTRKRVFDACENKCPDNHALLEETILLRGEAAKLLEYESHACIKLETKMAKNPNNVHSFLENLRLKLIPGGLNDLQKLNAFKQHLLEARPNQIHCQHDQILPWDYAFYRRLMLQEQLQINGQTIKEYFPLERTLSSMLELFSTLFSLKFVEVSDNDKLAEYTWHSSVQMFCIYNDLPHNDSFLGYLYLDLFHRTGKCPQALCCNIQPGFTKSDGSRNYPATALLCDFPPPTSQTPCLPGHFNTVLMFHELGHGIHDLVSTTKYSCFHGPEGVSPDFGEIPSQMMEQWFWIPSQIKKFSFHYSYLSEKMFNNWQNSNPGAQQPEKSMPDSVITSLVESRRLTFGPNFYLEQLQKAIFDLEINEAYGNSDNKTFQLSKRWNDLSRELRPGYAPPGYDWGRGYTTFSHLMLPDYEAGYYTYLYSQVYAADLFYGQFLDSIDNCQQGQKYRQCVLEKGGSHDEMHGICTFLGRKPSVKAFNKYLLNLP